MRYLLGDTDLAARRLKVLAEVYKESTRSFVLESVDDDPHLLVDLGCGPGHTTHFLADILRCDRAVGLDNSEHFIELARKTETDRISFRLHDVTEVPFPMESADVLYCRYLLTHMRDPQRVVSGWGTQLRPKGLLLTEEVEWIDTRNETFALYLEIIAAMLTHQSAELYVGPMLDNMNHADILRKKASAVRRLRVSNRDAATMFSMNIRMWKNQPFIKENYAASVIEDLEHTLEALAGTADGKTEIEWGLRQIVFERI